MENIPVVRLHDFTHGTPEERDRFTKTLGDGLVEYGFVTVDGHEVPLALQQRVFDMAARFFALPEVQKREYIVHETGGARGYTAFGRERAVGAKVSDLKEFWHVGQELAEGPLAKLYPRNVWPSEVAEFRATMLEVYQAFERHAQVLLEATALYLKLPADHFAKMAVQGNSVLRLIHYPPVGDDAPAGAVRAAAHEDINLITLLCEASAGGLELLTRRGDWLPVRALHGQIVCDAGDMLALATNGVIPATTHRVVNPEGKNHGSRYSMPFFVHPRPEVLLEPAPTTVGAEGPKYQPVTAHDFLTERLRAIGLFAADPLHSIS